MHFPRFQSRITLHGSMADVDCVTRALTRLNDSGDFY